MILVLGKSALSVPDTRFSRVSGSTLIDIFFKDGVSKFLAQVHMRPKAHPVCLKAQRFVVILSAHK